MTAAWRGLVGARPADYEAYRPPYLSAAVMAGAVFLLYVATLAPTTAFWDASEYIATAHILGIPHPPGNPLFVVLARSWSLLLSPTGLPVAVRVNLFAAFTSSLASLFLFLVAHRILTRAASPGWPALIGAAAATLIGATAYTVWNQSTVNEKVYTVSVTVIAAVTWLALRWRDRMDEPGSERILVAAIYLIVLGSTNHLMSVLPAPALALFVVLVGPAVLARRGFWLRAIPAALLGLSFSLVLPVRAAQSPVIAEGDPRCESVTGAFVSVYTLGKRGCPSLSSVLTREQYQKPPVTQRMAPVGHQMANWFQYFDWQWARGADPGEVPGNARMPFTLLFAILGLAGLWAVWKADRAAFLYVAPLVVTLTAGLVFYLNFRYGYSLAPLGAGDASEVRERDYFFIAGFLLWGTLAGLGLAWGWSRVARSLPTRRAWALSSPLLLFAFVPLGFNWSWASRAGDYAARDWAYDILMSVEPYGIIFTNGDNDTFPLWYVQEVEGIRQDVTVIVGQYLFTTWYPRQLQEISSPGRQRGFGPDSAVELYGEAAPPTRPVTTADPARLDQVRGAILDRDVTVSFPDLAVMYPEGMELDRSHQIALTIIRDSIDERPIYFATGTAGMMAELGLERWGVRHGLVTKFEPRPLDEPRREGLAQTSAGFGGDLFDYPRTLRLYREVYRFRSLKDRDVWFDRATLNIPWYFYSLALQLTDLADMEGEPSELVEELGADAQGFLITAQGGIRGTPRL